MASSFNTLQRRELFSFSHCKCLSTSTTLPPHNSVTFPLKLSPFFLVKAPVSAKTPVSSRILSSLDSNSSTETAQLSKISEILDSGYSSFERIKEGRNGKAVVDNNSGRSRQKGGNFDYERKKRDNGSENASFRRGGKRGERKLGEIGGKVANGDVRKNHNVAKTRGERKLGEIVGKVANGGVRKNHNVAKTRGGDKSPSFVSKWVKESNLTSSSSGFVDRSVEKEAIKGDSVNKKVKKKEKVPKKNKTPSPEFQLRIGLDMCSKKGDVMGAISLYDSAVKNGTRMAQYHYTVLLYLCSSAAVGVVRPAKSGSASRSLDTVAPQNLDGGFDSDDDEEEEEEEEDDVGDEAHNTRYQNQNQKLEGNEIIVGDDVKKYARERGFEIYERMCSDKVEMNEAALTSVARMAMAVGDGDMAFDVVKQMKSLGISPKLRSYGPALSVYSGNGDVEKAFGVEEHMLENGVDPEEPELEALLRVSVETGKADRVYYVLHKLRTKVRSVSPSTADLIEKWFKSKESSRIGKRKWDLDMIAQTMENVGGGWHGKGWLGRGKWSVSRTSVGTDGLCKCCGERLALIDLDPEETERFAESVATIATKREKNSSFQTFQRWLDYYGPFEAVVDAANVGLYSQRTFKPSKVNAIVNGIRQMHPSRKWPLIVLHNRRVTGGKLDKPINRELIERWKNADALYATPTGSNDDWYWLYAAIKFKCLLVTNDEMRDHTFQLLGNDFFPKWKERHQVRFSFSELGPIFHMPPPCSVVIQESEKGHWHVPIVSEHQSEEERIWLCVTRPKSLIWNQNHTPGADSKDSEEDIKNKRQHGSSISHSSHQMIAPDLK